MSIDQNSKNDVFVILGNVMDNLNKLCGDEHKLGTFEQQQADYKMYLAERNVPTILLELHYTMLKTLPTYLTQKKMKESAFQPLIDFFKKLFSNNTIAKSQLFKSDGIKFLYKLLESCDISTAYLLLYLGDEVNIGAYLDQKIYIDF